MAVELEEIADEAGIATPEPDSQQARQWSMWMADALLQIRVRLGDVNLLDAAVVDYVVRKSVAEKIKRPDGATSVEVAVDDARVSRTYNKASGQVTILPEWWAMLSPQAERGRAFSIDMTPKRDGVTYEERPDLLLQWFWPTDSLTDELPAGARDL